MGKGSSSAPAAPDPVATANAQAAANKEAAIAATQLGMVNQVTPYGNLQYTQRGTAPDGTPQYTATTTLSPEQQSMLDIENQIGAQLLGTGQNLLGRVGESTATPFSMGAFGAAPQVDDAARQKVEDALYGRATSRLDPRWDQDQTRLETKLANQGFSLDSEGYGQAMDDFSRQRTDAYDQARLGAESQAISEQNRLFGLESTARQNAIQEALLERGQPLQEIQALLGTSPAISSPQFVSTPTQGIAPADISGNTYASYQGQLNNYNQQRATSNALMGSIFGLGGQLGSAAILAPALASDENIKTDKRGVDEDSILKKVKSLPVETWRYKGDGQRRIGPYAQDFSDRFGGTDEGIDPISAFGVSFAAIKALADKVDRLEKR